VFEEKIQSLSNALVIGITELAEKNIFNEFEDIKVTQQEKATRKLTHRVVKESENEVYEEDLTSTSQGLVESACGDSEKAIFGEFVAYQNDPEEYALQRSIDSTVEHLVNKTSQEAVNELVEDDMKEQSTKLTNDAVFESEKAIFDEYKELVDEENTLVAAANKVAKDTVVVAEEEILVEHATDIETNRVALTLSGDVIEKAQEEVLQDELNEQKDEEVSKIIEVKQVLDEDKEGEIEESRPVVEEIIEMKMDEDKEDEKQPIEEERVVPDTNKKAHYEEPDENTKMTSTVESDRLMPANLTDTMTSEIDDELVLNNTLDNCQVDVVPTTSPSPPPPVKEDDIEDPASSDQEKKSLQDKNEEDGRDSPSVTVLAKRDLKDLEHDSPSITAVAKRDLKDLEDELIEKEKKRQTTFMLEEERIRQERESLVLQQQSLKNERLRLEVEAERARLTRLQEKQKEEEKRHEQELEQIRYRTEVLKEKQSREKERDQEHQQELEHLKSDFLANSFTDKITKAVAMETVAKAIDNVSNEAANQATKAIEEAVVEVEKEEFEKRRDSMRTPSPPPQPTTGVKLTASSSAGRKVLPDIPTITKIHKATPEEAESFKQMKKLKVYQLDNLDDLTTSPRSGDEEGITNLSAGRNISGKMA